MIDQDMRFDVPMIGVFLLTLRPPGHRGDGKRFPS
jgi:hypothetical protein